MHAPTIWKAKRFASAVRGSLLLSSQTLQGLLSQSTFVPALPPGSSSAVRPGSNGTEGCALEPGSTCTLLTSSARAKRQGLWGISERKKHSCRFLDPQQEPVLLWKDFDLQMDLREYRNILFSALSLLSPHFPKFSLPVLAPRAQRICFSSPFNPDHWLHKAVGYAIKLPSCLILPWLLFAGILPALQPASSSQARSCSRGGSLG